MSSASSPIALPVLEQVASVLKVLAHPLRLRMVERLSAERLTVGQLSLELNMAPAAVSQHLNFMRSHGILSATRQSRCVYYRVVSPYAATLLSCIRRHAGSDASPRAGTH